MTAARGRAAATGAGEAIVRAAATAVAALAVVVVLGGGVWVSTAAAATALRFSTPSFTPTGGEKLIVADLTGDAIPDAAVLNPTCAGLTVLRGKGDGNFGRPVVSCTRVGYWGGVEGTAVADVSGDGRRDILLVGFGERGPISSSADAWRASRMAWRGTS